MLRAISVVIVVISVHIFFLIFQIILDQCRNQWWTFMKMAINLGVKKPREFLGCLSELAVPQNLIMPV
jgi:hypothetical protein